MATSDDVPEWARKMAVRAADGTLSDQVERIARALAKADREARDEERRNAAAYLLTKADAVPDGSGDWPPLAEAADAIINGEHAKDAAYGSLTEDVYARVDRFKRERKDADDFLRALADRPVKA